MTTSGKFAGAFDAIREAKEPATVEGKGTTTRAPRRRTPPPAPKTEEHRGPGRPPGKRSNPDYRQVTGLIPKDVHFEVSKALLEERGGEGGRDMGDLIAELFQNWLKSRKH